MKIVMYKKAKGLIGAGLGIGFLILVLFNVFGYVFDLKYTTVFGVMEQVNNYEVQSKLLKEAMKEVGVSTPLQAADVWAQGLKQRSAALQYAVMGNKLKLEYEEKLKDTAPNWVTGISSPWINNYEIVSAKEITPKKYEVEILFSTMTSAGPFGDYNAVLTIQQFGDFWRITDINTVKELDAYTGFYTENE